MSGPGGTALAGEVAPSAQAVAAPALPAPQPVVAPTATQRRILVEDARDAIEADAPIDYLWDPILPVGALGIITGDPKAGKSLLSLNLAFSAALGQPCLDLPIHRPQRVLYLNLEQPGQPFKNRVAKLRAAYGDLSPGRLLYSTALRFQYGMDRREVVSIAHAQGTQLLIVDTMSKINHGDENDASTMTRFMREMTRLRDEIGCTLVLLHHMNKRHWQDKDPAAGRRIRGSSAIHAEGDAYVFMERTGAHNFRAGFELRHAEAPDPVDLVLDPRGRFNVSTVRILTSGTRVNQEHLVAVAAALEAAGKPMDALELSARCGLGLSLVSAAAAEAVQAGLIHTGKWANRVMFSTGPI